MAAAHLVVTDASLALKTQAVLIVLMVLPSNPVPSPAPILLAALPTLITMDLPVFHVPPLAALAWILAPALPAVTHSAS